MNVAVIAVGACPAKGEGKAPSDGSVLFQTPLLDVAVWVVVFSVDPGDARAMADGFGVQTLRLPPGTRLCHLARQVHPHQLFLSGSGDGAGSRVGRLSASDRPNAIPPVGDGAKGGATLSPQLTFHGAVGVSYW